MSIPKALQYAASQFPMSRNSFKLVPYSTQVASASDQIQISMPANTIIDLTTLSVYALLNVVTTAGFAQLPYNVESMIDSVYWTANGVQITNVYPMYNVLCNAFLDYTAEDKRTFRQVLQNGGKRVIPAVDDTNVQVVWNNWLGLPSSATTKMIDTSAIGDLRLHIKLAPTTVLATNATAAGISYTASNIYATIDCISVNDGGLYASLLQKRMESGPLEIAFKDYYTFNMGSINTGSFTGRFSVASQSLDAIHCTLLPYQYTNVVSAAGYDTTTQNAGYFKRGMTDSAGFTSLITLNSVQYPAWGPTTLAETFNQTAIALGEHNNILGAVNPTINSLDNYATLYFWATTRLNSPGDASESSVRTGVDCRGNAAYATWQVNAAANNYTPVIFAETTKVWSISSGRQMSITA